MSDQADPFAAPADDPFADAAAQQDQQDAEPTSADIEPDVSDPADEIGAEPAEDIPVVNKEGEPVEAPQATDQPMSPEQAEQAPEDQGAPDGQEAPTEAPQDAQEPPQEPAPAAAEAEAAPARPEAANGKSPVRHYKVLYQTGPSTWEEADLKKVMTDGNANVVMVDGEPWLAARNNEHATRLAFGVLGRPTQGVTAFPVPKGAWKPRRVKPAPPKPDRERLEIS